VRASVPGRTFGRSGRAARASGAGSSSGGGGRPRGAGPRDLMRRRVDVGRRRARARWPPAALSSRLQELHWGNRGHFFWRLFSAALLLTAPPAAGAAGVEEGWRGRWKPYRERHRDLRRVPATYSATTRTGTLAFAQSEPEAGPKRHGPSHERDERPRPRHHGRDGALRSELHADRLGTLAVVGSAETTEPAILVKDNTTAPSGHRCHPRRQRHDAGRGVPSHGEGSAFDPAQRDGGTVPILDSMYTAARAFSMCGRGVPFAGRELEPEQRPQAGNPRRDRSAPPTSREPERDLHPGEGRRRHG